LEFFYKKTSHFHNSENQTFFNGSNILLRLAGQGAIRCLSKIVVWFESRPLARNEEYHHHHHYYRLINQIKVYGVQNQIMEYGVQNRPKAFKLQTRWTMDYTLHQISHILCHPKLSFTCPKDGWLAKGLFEGEAGPTNEIHRISLKT